MVHWEQVTDLTGITGTGEVLGVDFTADLPPSESNKARYYRVEEE